MLFKTVLGAEDSTKKPASMPRQEISFLHVFIFKKLLSEIIFLLISGTLIFLKKPRITVSVDFICVVLFVHMKTPGRPSSCSNAFEVHSIPLGFRPTRKLVSTCTCACCPQREFPIRTLGIYNSGEWISSPLRIRPNTACTMPSTLSGSISAIIS